MTLSLRLSPWIRTSSRVSPVPSSWILHLSSHHRPWGSSGLPSKSSGSGSPTSAIRFCELGALALVRVRRGPVALGRLPEAARREGRPALVVPGAARIGVRDAPAGLLAVGAGQDEDAVSVAGRVHRLLDVAVAAAVEQAQVTAARPRIPDAVEDPLLGVGLAHHVRRAGRPVLRNRAEAVVGEVRLALGVPPRKAGKTSSPATATRNRLPMNRQRTEPRCGVGPPCVRSERAREPPRWTRSTAAVGSSSSRHAPQ